MIVAMTSSPSPILITITYISSNILASSHGLDVTDDKRSKPCRLDSMFIHVVESNFRALFPEEFSEAVVRTTTYLVAAVES
jgi:hypothetical protein